MSLPLKSRYLPTGAGDAGSNLKFARLGLRPSNRGSGVNCVLVGSYDLCQEPFYLHSTLS